MDKQTLSNYGWIVICILVLCVMIALATPFGSFVANAVKSTTQGLFDVEQKALGAAGMVITDQSIEDSYSGNGGGSGDGYDHNAPELHPDNGTTPVNNETYELGDYTYTYKTASNGWKVAINTAVTDINQTEYGPILESINGEPVTDMHATFYGCTSLTTAPVIPSGVKDMDSTFYNCTSLITAPDMSNATSVKDMNETFRFCVALTTAPVIPSSVTNMYGTFNGCKSLTAAPVIPNGVTDISYAFAKCTSLTTAPAIPSSITDMYRTFNGCTSLAGTITINATPTNYGECFKKTQITEILGLCGNKSELLATK